MLCLHLWRCPCLREGCPSLFNSCGIGMAWHGMHSRAAPQPSTAAGSFSPALASVCRSQSTAPSALLHRDGEQLLQITMYLDNASFDSIPATRLTATLQYHVGSTTATVLRTAASPVQELHHILIDPSHAAMIRQHILRLPALNALRAMDPNPLPLHGQASAKCTDVRVGNPPSECTECTENA